jgi:SNF2 family DNA or RNA helicase
MKSLFSTKESLQSGSFVSVLGIVMQLKKCCNHPNLFEPRPVQTPFCVLSEPFSPFCRGLLIDKERPEIEFNELRGVNLNVPRTQSSSVIVKRESDKLPIEKANDRIRSFKNEWAVDALNK